LLNGRRDARPKAGHDVEWWLDNRVPNGVLARSVPGDDRAAEQVVEADADGADLEVRVAEVAAASRQTPPGPLQTVKALNWK
jgi:hypothetical protein